MKVNQSKSDNQHTEKQYYEDSSSEDKPISIGDIIQNRFLITQKIGEGSFGSVFKIVDQNNDTIQLAMKIDTEYDDNSMLEREIKILIELRKLIGFPLIKYYGQERGYTYCIMTMLGKNLEHMIKKLGGTMSVNTVEKLAIQMIDRISTLHQHRFLHRDIKPDNFVLEIATVPKLLYLIDFGLSKHYINSKGEHIPYVKKAGLIGTARYASVSAHEEMEQCRRDDLESIGYVLIYLATGTLPWMNLQIEDKDKKYKQIYEIKKTIKNEELCTKLPNCFLQYMNYVKTLQFSDKPDYQKLKAMFEEDIQLSMTSSGISAFAYDWEKLPEYTKQKKHMTVHVMETQEKKKLSMVQLIPLKQSQVVKQNQFINQNLKEQQQKQNNEQQIITFEQIMNEKNEKKKGTRRTDYSPTGKSKKNHIMINIVEENEKNEQSSPAFPKSRDIQHYSNTFLQPSVNSQRQLDILISPSIATSRLNNYIESEDVVSEGGALPIWELCNGDKPEFQKINGILEGIKKPSLIILRKERKAHTQIDTVKLMQEMFVHPKKTIGDQEAQLEGLD